MTSRILFVWRLLICRLFNLIIPETKKNYDNAQAFSKLQMIHAQQIRFLNDVGMGYVSQKVAATKSLNKWWMTSRYSAMTVINFIN
jgi:hypothetical protein